MILRSIKFAVLAVSVASACALGCSEKEGGSLVDVPTTTCASGKQWQSGNSGTDIMHPGGNCISCHASGEGPGYTIAGTVYAAAGQADDCAGVMGVTVELLDKNGQTWTFVTNEAGNFFGRGGIAMPYTAKVTSGGKTRAMSAAQSDGDCASCHTVAGANGAPGRILSP